MENALSICVLPGGKLPERQTDGAIGYDTYLRAVVSANEMSPKDQKFRKTLFDFEELPRDVEISRHIFGTDDGFIYRMDPGESVLVGIGFVTQMPFPMFYWVTPRSGLSSKWGITVTNAPGTVDPDYRGEAGVLVYNRNKTTFDLKHNMRIAQIVFQIALIPEFKVVEGLDCLGDTPRGAGGFGSTGLK